MKKVNLGHAPNCLNTNDAAFWVSGFNDAIDEFKKQPKSERAKDWHKFSEQVKAHIDGYTVPQYGDKGEDIASEYSAESCINQVKKYAARFGKNSRPGQERLDLLKMAHYIQMAFEALENSENGNDSKGA